MNTKFVMRLAAITLAELIRTALLTLYYGFRVSVNGVFFPRREQIGLDSRHGIIGEMLKIVG